MSEQEKPFEVREAEAKHEFDLITEGQETRIHQKLNNFWMYFLPEQPGQALPRTRGTMPDIVDKRPAEYVRPESLANVSVVRQKQTNREFYETLDRVLRDLDSELEIQVMLAQTQKVVQQESENEEQEKIRVQALKKTSRALNLALAPVYIRLKAMGYTETDFGATK